MSEEVLIPKMRRKPKNKQSGKIPLLNIAIIIFAVLMIIGASFLNLDIKHFIIPSDLFSNKNLSIDNFTYSFSFIPQIPVIMFICSVLGRKMALTSIILYILLGLICVPIFALGGGVKYIFEFGFGYILAYIPAVAIAGKLLNKYSFLDMLKAVCAGVIIIHTIGILYMIIIALFKHMGGDFISSWIRYQSGLKILYDIIISYVLVLIGKYLNMVIKFVL